MVHDGMVVARHTHSVDTDLCIFGINDMATVETDETGDTVALHAEWCTTEQDTVAWRGLSRHGNIFLRTGQTGFQVDYTCHIKHDGAWPFHLSDTIAESSGLGIGGIVIE